jgi:hypothetical protein
MKRHVCRRYGSTVSLRQMQMRIGNRIREKAEV